MLAVGEGNVLVDHISLEIFDLVAPFLQAARIVDHRMGHRWLFARNEVGQGDLPVDPFPFHMIEEPRLIVALRARHVSMARVFPRVDIRIHLVTEATEGGCFRKPEKTHADNKKGDDAEEQEDFYPFEVFLGASPCLVEEIDPEFLHQTIEILKRFHPKFHL
jgi:hypothetical protein